MAKRDEPAEQEKQFYNDIDRNRLESGWSCWYVVILLIILYGIGVALLIRFFG